MTGGVLATLRARLGAWVWTRTLLLVLGATSGGALALMVFDAVLDLPEGLRAAAPWLLAGCAAVLLGAGACRLRALTEPRVARLFEGLQPELGNRLINAVQLSAVNGRTEVEEYLRLEAVELGRRAAGATAVWPAAKRGVTFAMGLVGVSLVAWLALVVGARGVYDAVAPRFLDPHGDHPPYSRLRFEVTPGETRVLYGGQVEVRAAVQPSPADAGKLWLVARSGTNTLRTMMFLAPDRTFFQTLANLREPSEYYVTDGRARSRRFPIGIRYTPQITLVEVTTTFPSYTGKAARTSKLGDEPQALPEETQVSFRVFSNRPLKSGELTLTPVLGGEVKRIPLAAEAQNHVVAGGFALSEPVVFSLSVRDVSDLVNADPRQGRINVLPDERPRLFVLEPGRDAVATPSIRIPVRVEASDDYGVTRVAWLRAHNRSTDRPLSMKVALKSGPQSVEAAGSFDFDKLGVRPGDVIEYYFEAADNYPKGPNLALSKVYRIEIISQQQYEAVLRQAAARKALFEPYFQLDAWLRRLAERSRKLAQQAETGSDAAKGEVAKEAAALAEDLAKYEKELGALLQQATLFDVEQAFRASLSEQQAGIGKARERLEPKSGSGQADAKQLAEASEELSRLAQQEEEEVGTPARQIADVANLVARADTFVKLAQQEAALARILRRFSDRTNNFTRIEQMELQEMAHQQRRVQEQLAALMASLPELLARLPAEEQFDLLREDVKAFVEAVAEAKIEADLAEAARALPALDGKSGHAAAQRAAEKMDRLIAKCRGLMNQPMRAALRFQPSIQQAMGNTMEQILAAMGANAGSGQGGKDGYGLFNDDVALYGPNMQLAGEQAGGRGQDRAGGARRSETVSGKTRDPSENRSTAPGRVRLQPDTRFPLRYRELVGEYFRVIAESETESGGNK